MKRRTWLVFVVGFASLGVSGAAQSPVMPTGKITLKMVGGVCKATLSGGDLAVNVKINPSVAWEVTNECQSPQKVIVGRTTQTSTHYAVLDCGGGVALSKPGSKTLTCKVDRACAGAQATWQVYKYAVCVNGQVAIDPDLRVGGGGTLGGQEGSGAQGEVRGRDEVVDRERRSQ